MINKLLIDDFDSELYTPVVNTFLSKYSFLSPEDINYDGFRSTAYAYYDEHYLELIKYKKEDDIIAIFRKVMLDLLITTYNQIYMMKKNAIDYKKQEPTLGSEKMIQYKPRDMTTIPVSDFVNDVIIENSIKPDPLM